MKSIWRVMGKIEIENVGSLCLHSELKEYMTSTQEMNKLVRNLRWKPGSSYISR